MPARQVGMCASCAATQLRTPPASATRLRTPVPLAICANAGSAVRNSVLGERGVRNRVRDEARKVWRARFSFKEGKGYKYRPVVVLASAP